MKELAELKKGDGAKARDGILDQDLNRPEKKETRNQYCQTMMRNQLSDFDYDHQGVQRSGGSRRSSHRFFNDASRNHFKNSFRTDRDNPFEPFGNKDYSSCTDIDMKEKRNSMKLKYQQIQRLKKNHSKRQIYHPRVSMLSHHNSFNRTSSGNNTMRRNTFNIQRSSERLQKFYEEQANNSFTRRQSHREQFYTSKLYNSFQQNLQDQTADDNANEDSQTKEQFKSARISENQEGSLGLNQSQKQISRDKGRNSIKGNIETFWKQSADLHGQINEHLKIVENSDNHFTKQSGKSIILEENEEVLSPSHAGSIKKGFYSNSRWAD